MKIVLVWPKGFDSIYVMPIPLGYLASNMPSNHEVKIFDCSINNISANTPEFKNLLTEFAPRVVGVSCWSSTYPEAIRVIEAAKSIDPNVVTVIGGAHATSYPNRTMDNKSVDFLFRGESELYFPIFLEELEKNTHDWGKVKGLAYRTSDGALVKNEIHIEKELDKIKIPDYDIIGLEQYIKSGYRLHTKYKRNAPIWLTRGCPYRCGFCSAPLQNGKLVRTHSIEYIVEWVKYMYYERGIKLINIIDDNFTFHVKWAKEFCKAMIDLNIKDLHFSTPNGIRVQRSDSELFGLMKQAGWEHLVIAPESGSPKTLNRMCKDLNLDIIVKKVQEIRDAGLKAQGFFILGYPGETIEDIKMTEQFARKSKFNMVYFNNFQPLPGTPIYNELVESQEIEDGLLPAKSYSSGERVYTPKELKDFNFPLFVLKNYLYMIVRKPSSIFYMLLMFSPIMLISKFFSNLKNMALSHLSKSD